MRRIAPAPARGGTPPRAVQVKVKMSCFCTWTLPHPAPLACRKDRTAYSGCGLVGLLQREIAQGGSATVYEALVDGVRVALKVISDKDEFGRQEVAVVRG